MKFVLRAALGNPAVVTAFFGAFIVAGLFSFFNMPRKEDPEVNPPFGVVITPLPGASAATVERLVTEPLETAIGELPDLKTLVSGSRTGVSVITIELFHEADVLDRFRTLRRLVSEGASELPSDALPSDIRAENLLDVGIMTMAVSATGEGTDSTVNQKLTALAESLESRVKKLSGISRVAIQGTIEKEVRVETDLHALAVRRVPFTRLLGALQSANNRLPGGDIAIQGSRFPVETSGAFERLSEVAATTIDVSPTGTPVKVADVATVALGEEDARVRARYMGRPAVLVTPYMQDGAKITALGERLSALVDDFRSSLAPGFHVDIASNQSARVDRRISKFVVNLLQGLGLVIGITAIALGLGGMIPIAAALPLAMLMGLALMDAVGIELQQMSLYALVLVIGMLVDNSIVITENVERHMRFGKSSRDAALDGTYEVAGSVLSSTLTTIVAFIPLAFMSDNAGEFIRSMPIVVSLTLASSYVVAMVVTPALATRLYRPQETIATRLERWAQPKFDRFLWGALRHPWVTLGISGMFLAGTIWVIVGTLNGNLALVGLEYFPKSESRECHIDITTPVGSHITTTEQAVKKVETALAQVPEIASYTATVGEGFPRFFYNVFPRSSDESHAQIHLRLTKDGRPTPQILAAIKALVGPMPGTRVEYREMEQGPPVGAPVVVRISGEEIPTIRKAAVAVIGRLKGSPIIEDVYDDFGPDIPRVSVDVDRDRAARVGLSEGEIAAAVRMAITGVQATTLRQGDEEIPIVVSAKEDERQDIGDLNALFVDARATGKTVPIRQVAEVVPDFTPGQIRHRDFERTISVRVWGAEDVPTTDLERVVRSVLADYTAPSGVTLTFGGETEHRTRSFASLGQLGLVALMAVFIILVIQYRSLSKPFAILAALPLSIIGAVVGLMVLKTTMGFMSIVGMVSLIGVVVNDSIVLVEFIEQQRRQGEGLDAAIREGVRIRLRPIFMTTVTTIFGMIPLTFFGGVLWRPLGAVIIFGLLFATLLTLVVIPVLYRQIEKANELITKAF
ncbi:MAG: efflux RND transporter permease subunit [Myxococcota bacterium]|nr:efflux RND transporter permease subunit [Myxococcota bacterium]